MLLWECAVTESYQLSVPFASMRRGWYWGDKLREDDGGSEAFNFAIFRLNRKFAWNGAESEWQNDSGARIAGEVGSDGGGVPHCLAHWPETMGKAGLRKWLARGGAKCLWQEAGSFSPWYLHAVFALSKKEAHKMRTFARWENAKRVKKGCKVEKNEAPRS